MKNRTIFIITTFEKCEPNDKLGVDIGDHRSPCFRYTFEDAEEVVKNNICDIWETCYDYAVIEEIDCRLYSCSHIQKFYKYNRDIDGYEPIEKPECCKVSMFSPIG